MFFFDEPHLKKTYLLWLFIFFQISFGKSQSELMFFSTSDIDSNTKEITITFVVPEKDFIYKDFIHCSVYEPTVTLSPWQSDKTTNDYYDPSFNETKKVFSGTFSISMHATITKWIPDPIYFYCSYYRKSEKKMDHQLFIFSFISPIQNNPPIEEIEEIKTTHSIAFRNHISLFEVYTTKLNLIIHKIIKHFTGYYYVYFFILIFFIFILYATSYYCKQQLQTHQALKEIIIFTRLSLLVIAIGGIHFHFRSHNFLHAHFIFAWLSTLSFGYLYIKKSTQTFFQSLSTFYTLFGILLIAGSFILLFKSLQF